MNTKQDARKLDVIGKEGLRRRTVRAVMQRGLTKAEAARVIVITDGHPAHKGKRLTQWLKEHASQCELVLLPGYAPELNSDELLNQDLKSNVFSSGRPRTQTDLIDQTRCYLRTTQKRPDIVRAYFQEAHVSYAAE